MATLEFCDKHNMVAYLEKPEESAEFHQIIDFLTNSHIHYALTENPTIYASFIKQFWTTATASTNVHGEVKLTASIDRQAKTITEASLRRHLKLEDDGGIISLPNTEIFEQLALMRYATDSDKFTFQKGNFSPPWRFFIHTILHCLSPKKTYWEQFSSNITTAIICLSTNRTFNFSKFIFDAMQRRLLQPHIRTYPTPVLTRKVFSNMKRVTRGYSGDDIPLFPSMITAPETSPSRITSSPSLSPQHTPGSVSLNELMALVTQLTNKVGSLENELMNTKKVYGSAITKLVNRVKKLEKQVKTGTTRKGTMIVLSEDEAVEEDSSKQGRSLIEELDMDVDFSLVPPHDAKIQENICDDTEVTTADSALNTASVPFSTATATLEVSTAAESLVYIRRSVKKKKDKGKAIVIEDESVQKKSKKQVQEERLEYDKVRKKEAVSKVDIAHVIDWDDPVVIRYHALQNRPRSVAEVRKNMMVYLKNLGGYKMKDFKGVSYDDIRPIFKKLWDQIHSFVTMDSKEESVQEQTDEDPKINELSIIVPDEGINIEALQTKYPIIGWEVHFNDTMQFWKIIKVVQERYNSSGLTEDKEIELWVELKMLFEPNADNLLEL
ncbi:hypothetical protein Tco_0656443 [Tanacetum coccineum]|uniref:Synaptobrevin, longin-like domain protein n=1 Tax=Tanacetum coccineum TaxID=301880 RepID=A0ABQ4X8S0_9ASTR